MAIRDKNDLRKKFASGKYPTSQDFTDLMDTFFGEKQGPAGPPGPQGETGDGWTALYTYEQYESKNLKKLYAYYGGTGNAPTAHIGEYLTANGGFTDDKELAGDFTNESEAATYNNDFDI